MIFKCFLFFFYGFDYSSRFREMNVSEKELFLTFSVVRGNRAFRNYKFSNCKLKNLAIFIL